MLRKFVAVDTSELATPSQWVKLNHFIWLTRSLSLESVWHSIIVSLYTEFFPFEQSCFPLEIFKKRYVSIDSKCSETHRNAKKITPMSSTFPFAAEFSNYNTIKRTEVSTFSPSLIKIRPLVSEIKAVKARQTHRETQIKYVGVYSLQTVTIKKIMIG